MNFAFYIARRYLISRSKNNAINIIAAIASSAIVVGAAALFVVLSVFSGLREFSLSFSNNSDPDLKLSPKQGKFITLTSKQQKALSSLPEITAFSAVVEERVLFMFSGKEKVAFIKGVDSNFVKVNQIQKSLFSGRWLQNGTIQAVVGYKIINDLSMGLFDYQNPLEVYVPKAGKNNIEKPDDAFVLSHLIPVGTYTISEDLDSKYVYTDLSLVQDLLQYLPNQVSHLEIRLSPGADEQQVTNNLDMIFNNTLLIKNRMQQNDALYKMLNTENIAVYLIFTLVIIIALFNLVGALIMMILDKKNNLKTMLHLGARVSDLRKIFFFHGTLLSAAGGILGVAVASILIFVQQEYQIIMITDSLPYPVNFNFENVLLVLGTIALLGIAASWIAASRVQRSLLT